MKPRFGDPTNSAVNGCGTHVTNCQNFMSGAGIGASWSLGSPTGCAASAGPNPTAGTARSHAECASNVGPECERVAVAESARLLRHEQGHFDITCILVHKANALLASGTAQATVARALLRRYNALTPPLRQHRPNPPRVQCKSASFVGN